MARRSPTAPPDTTSDKSDVRHRLLEAGGRVFAEKGFDRATGKEITELAGTNSAAINYYYGSMEGLYRVVVRTAHDRLVPLDALSAQGSAEDRFRAMADMLVRTALGPLSSTWALRIIGREFAAPSSAFHGPGDPDAVPKMQLFAKIVGEMLHLPQDDPAVARACIAVIAPFMLLLIANRQTLQRALPSLGLTPADTDAMVRQLVEYAVGGLAAVTSGPR